MRNVLSLFSLAALCFSSNATAIINVTDGPINPTYPGASPDPWNAGATLDLDESTLIIDNGSLVSATTLFIDGRVLVSSAGLIDVDTTTILTGSGGAKSGAAFHLDGGNVNAGAFSVEENAVLYIGVENAGVFSTQSAGGFGASATMVISMDDGGQFLGVGNTAMGANNSSFILGPSPADPSGYLPTLSSITQLVNTGIATISDTAMNNITAASGGSGLAGVGNDTLFQLTGDLTIGGSGSGALIHLNDNSKLNVTGNMTLPMAASISDIVVVDSDFDVGGNFNFLNGDGSSATVFLSDSTFDVGGVLATSAAANSTLTMTATGTPITTVGAAQLIVGNLSAMELTYTDSPHVIGGTFLTGSASASGSSYSLKGTNSDFTVAGDMQLNVGENSVMNGEFSGGLIDLTGDFRFSSLGPNSTITLTVNGTSFTTGGSLLLDRVGDASSASFTLENVSLDVTDDVQVSVTGTGSDALLFVSNITGQIGQDLNFLTGISNSVTNHVMVGATLSVGRDLTYLITETATPSEQTLWFLSGSSFTVTRDVILDTLSVATFVDTSISAGGSFSIKGKLQPKNLTLTGDVNVASSGTLRMTVPATGTSGQSINVTGDFSLAAGSSVVLELKGTTPNAAYQPIVHSGDNPLVLSGNLQLAFPDGMPGSTYAGQTIPLITSSMPISGAFQNVGIGQVVPTAGGSSPYILMAGNSGDTLYLQVVASSVLFEDSFEAPQP